MQNISTLLPPPSLGAASPLFNGSATPAAAASEIRCTLLKIV